MTTCKTPGCKERAYLMLNMRFNDYCEEHKLIKEITEFCKQ